MKIQELLKQYKGLHLSKPSFDAMVLTIVNNSEVRAVLDSHGLNSRAFVCMTSGNLLVGRKCLEVRVPFDVWYDRVDRADEVFFDSGVSVDDLCAPSKSDPAPDVHVELAKLRAWVKALAVAGLHAFDPDQRYRSTQVLDEINENS